MQRAELLGPERELLDVPAGGLHRLGVAPVGRQLERREGRGGVHLGVTHNLPLHLRRGDVFEETRRRALARDAAGDVGQRAVHERRGVHGDHHVAGGDVVRNAAALLGGRALGLGCVGALAPLHDERRRAPLERLLENSRLLGVLAALNLLLVGLVGAAHPLQRGGLRRAAGARRVAELRARLGVADHQGHELLHALGQVQARREPRQAPERRVGAIVAQGDEIPLRPIRGVHLGEGHGRLHHRDGVGAAAHLDAEAGGVLRGRQSRDRLALLQRERLHLHPLAVGEALVRRLGVDVAVAKLGRHARGVHAVLAVLQPAVVVREHEEVLLALAVADGVQEEVHLRVLVELVVAHALVQRRLRGAALLKQLVRALQIQVQRRFVSLALPGNLVLGEALGGPGLAVLGDDGDSGLVRGHAERLLPALD